MGLRAIGAEELGRVLSVEAAIDALEAAFGTEQLPAAPLRTHMETTAGELLLMPAHGERGVGVKLVTVTLSNPRAGLPLIHGLYVLFAAGTQEALAVIDGAALTALRTAAVSGLATRYLALPSAHRLVLFGAGVQATAHLEAMAAVRPIDEVRVVSRTGSRAQRLVRRAGDLGIRAEVGSPDTVAHADVVCTCTTSPAPVFDGSLLLDGAHVNAVGGYTPETRELDDAVVRRGRLVVETRQAALAEAGDLLIPIAAGIIEERDIVADLAEVVRGAPVRRGPEDVTVFKSVGVAFEDLIVARAAVEAIVP